MKKFMFMFLTLICLFSLSCNVNASSIAIGSSTDRYVKFNYSYVYQYGARFASGDGYKGYIGYYYTPDSNSSSRITNKDEYAFCLDPGLKSPTALNDAYKYARNLNLDYYFDKRIYKLYQNYIKKLVDNQYSKDTILGYTDVALRTYSFLNEDNTNCYEGGHDCVAVFNANTNASTHFNQFKEQIAPYVSGNNSSLSLPNSAYTYFGSKYVIDQSKNFFSNIINDNEMWNNPLQISPSKSYDEINKIYTFTFKIKFSNATSKYFDDNNHNLINGDYNIGYGDAKFNAELTINNGAYAVDEGNTVEHSPRLEITKWGANDGKVVNDERTLILKMTKDIYDSIITQSGEVKVGLQFEAYHPMDSRNIFLNYYNERSDNNNALYQRMVVFSEFIVKDTIYSDGTSTEDTPIYNLCSQSGNSFKYGEDVLALGDYIDKCTCSNVDSNSLSGNLKTIYTNKCGSIKQINVTSDLKTCNYNEEYESNYNINYEEKSSINNYCILTCDESIKLNDLKNKFSTKAGMKFEFSKYPYLIANKTCDVNIKYNDWKRDYDILINEEINSYNSYLKDYAIENATCRPASCGDFCTKEICSYSYNEYYKNGNNISTNTRNGSYYSSNAPSTNSGAKYAAFITSIGKVDDHFTSINSCGSALSNMGSDDKFYQFKVGLKYNYEQTLLLNNHQLRTIDNENNTSEKENDSDLVCNFPIKDNSLSQNYNNISYVDLINLDGNGEPVRKQIPTNTSLNRQIGYTYNFKPSLEKYVDSYTGKISSNKSSLHNPISLGNVYDTDASAKPIDNNNDKYYFSSLGDKNQIYKYLDEHHRINQLERSCTYEIKSDVLSLNNNPGNDTSSKIVYRVVDPLNIDPNNRIGNNGMSNWNNKKGEVVKNDIQNDTFNPSNIEYSFTLDSAKIQEIKEQNDTSNYSDFMLECNNNEDDKIEGAECRSSFIDKYASNKSGRDNWKYLLNNSNNSWILQSYKTGEMKQATFNSLSNQLGSGLQP